eukprot:scaffold429592_cov46-Prasinocladus_malaysianus.AAC.1
MHLVLGQSGLGLRIGHVTVPSDKTDGASCLPHQRRPCATGCSASLHPAARGSHCRQPAAARCCSLSPPPDVHDDVSAGPLGNRGLNVKSRKLHGAHQGFPGGDRCDPSLLAQAVDGPN